MACHEIIHCIQSAIFIFHKEAMHCFLHVLWDLNQACFVWAYRLSLFAHSLNRITFKAPHQEMSPIMQPDGLGYKAIWIFHVTGSGCITNSNTKLIQVPGNSLLSAITKWNQSYQKKWPNGPPGLNPAIDCYVYGPYSAGKSERMAGWDWC